MWRCVCLYDTIFVCSPDPERLGGCHTLQLLWWLPPLCVRTEATHFESPMCAFLTFATCRHLLCVSYALFCICESVHFNEWERKLPIRLSFILYTLHACPQMTLISLYQCLVLEVSVLDPNFTPLPKEVYCKTLGKWPMSDPTMTATDDECKHRGEGWAQAHGGSN